MSAMPWYPLYRRLGVPLDWFGQVWKNLVPTRIQSPDCPAVSRKIQDYTILAHEKINGDKKNVNPAEL